MSVLHFLPKIWSSYLWLRVFSKDYICEDKWQNISLKCACLPFLQLIGRSIGQLFRKEVRIAELPRLDLPRRYKTQRVDETEGEAGLCTLFKHDKHELNWDMKLFLWQVHE